MIGATASYNSNVVTSTVSNTAGEILGCTEDDLNLPSPIRYILFLFGVVLVVENVLMIVTIARNRELHTNTNILVASLAVSDVIIGLLCMQMAFISKPNGLRSHLGMGGSGLRTFDSLAGGANCALVFVSLAHLAAVSVDRYLYILWPLQYFRRVSQCRVAAVSVGIWVVSCIYSLLPIWVFSDPKYHENCFIFYPPNEYAAGPLVCFHFVCIIIVSISTFGIAKLALDQGRKREIRQNGGDWNGEMGATTETKQICSLHCNKDKHVGSKEKTNARKDFPLATVSLEVEGASTTRPIYLANKRHGASTAKPTLVSPTINSDVEDHITDLDKPKLKTNGFVVKSDLLEGLDQSLESAPFDVDKIDKETMQFSVLPAPQLHPMESDGEMITKTDLPQRRMHNSIERSGKREEIARRRFDKSKLKVLKFVVMMFGSYLLCVSPSIVFLILNKLLHVVNFSKTVIVCVTLILFLNSGVNFFIMVHLNKTFRSILSNSFPYRYLKLCFRQAKQTLKPN